ncbi:MAG TPA: ABC transporter substrate-binding protein, partial [Clostridia bacterium]|nr:ABC transporter substrate-binding protein [Clostridia bacterium]
TYCADSCANNRVDNRTTNRRYGFILAALFLAGCLFFAGCTGGTGSTTDKNGQGNGGGNGNITGQGFPVTVEDSFGRTVHIEQEPQRIITLAPGNTEIVYALGLQDKLVGVTKYCNYPVEALEKEKIGGYSDPNIEKIISLNPDLIFATREHREFVPEFENIGINVVILQTTTVDGVLDIVGLAGEATGRTDEANAVISTMREKIELVDGKIKNVPEESKPSVYYEVFDEPIMTAGPGTPTHDIITRAGGINVAADADNTYPQYSMEVLVKKNPEVIIAAKYNMEIQTGVEAMTAEEMDRHDAQVIENIKQRAGWTAISAVTNDRVYLIDDDLITADGPRVADGLVAMAKILYPDKFADQTN